MAKTKAELISEAKDLGIKVDSKAKVAEIKALIDEHNAQPSEASKPEAKKAEVAKAGKRSAKAIAEQEAKQAKQERKASEPTEEANKVISKPTRSKAERRGKLFRDSLEKFDHTKAFSIEEAAKLAKQTSHVKFDATVELHVNLAIDPRHADQNVRDNVLLPHGTGKTVRIAVVSDDEAAAKAAGADIFKVEDILSNLSKGVIDFDILIAAPNQMPQLGKYARVLGPRGLMPNPKSGTVATDINRAVAEAKAGRIEYRADSTGIIHVGVGKVSFTEAQLQANIQAVIASLRSNKPASVKGTYIKAIHLATTMGPSIRVDLSSI